MRDKVCLHLDSSIYLILDVGLLTAVLFYRSPTPSPRQRSSSATTRTCMHTMPRCKALPRKRHISSALSHPPYNPENASILTVQV